MRAGPLKSSETRAILLLVSGSLDHPISERVLGDMESGAFNALWLNRKTPGSGKDKPSDGVKSPILISALTLGYERSSNR
jgi:hypothetical protein